MLSAVPRSVLYKIENVCALNNSITGVDMICMQLVQCIKKAKFGVFLTVLSKQPMSPSYLDHLRTQGFGFIAASATLVKCHRFGVGVALAYLFVSMRHSAPAPRKHGCFCGAPGAPAAAFCYVAAPPYVFVPVWSG